MGALGPSVVEEKTPFLRTKVCLVCSDLQEHYASLECSWQEGRTTQECLKEGKAREGTSSLLFQSSGECLEQGVREEVPGLRGPFGKLGPVATRSAHLEELPLPAPLEEVMSSPSTCCSVHLWAPLRARYCPGATSPFRPGLRKAP